MRQVAILMILLLLAISIGTAQGNAAVKGTDGTVADADTSGVEGRIDKYPLEMQAWVAGILTKQPVGFPRLTLHAAWQGAE